MVYDELVSNTNIRQLHLWRITEEHVSWIIKLIQNNHHISSLKFVESKPGTVEIMTNALADISQSKK